MPEIVLPTKGTQDDTNTRVKDIQTKVTDIKGLLENGVSAIKSVQRGTHSSTFNNQAEGSVTVTISAINTNKSMLLFDATLNQDVTGRIVDSNSIRFTRKVSNYTVITSVDWQIIEFY